MSIPVISKNLQSLRVSPNLKNYEVAVKAFSWEQAKGELEGLPSGRGLNIAHEAVDRHAMGIRRRKVALRFLRKDGAIQEFTYESLAEQSNRFANLLKDLGLQKGDKVFTHWAGCRNSTSLPWGR